MLKRCALAPMLPIALALGCEAQGGGDVREGTPDSAYEIGTLDTNPSDTTPPPDTSTAPDTAVEDTFDATPPPTELDLHLVKIYDNAPDIADWPVTTKITVVEFQYKGGDGIHVEFSKKDDGSWPDVTPPGWDGPLEYTMGIVENIGGKWYTSAAIQFWRGLEAFGGNVAEDIVTKTQCTSFGYGSSCQIAKNWYYDSRWGELSGYQPKTGELIGIFVVAGNLRGVKDGSQSPVKERSNVVLVPMPTIAGAKYTF